MLDLFPMSIPPLLLEDGKRSYWIVRTNFRLRSASFAFVFIGLAPHLHALGTGVGVWLMLALQFLVYPHILYWRARRAADPQKTELSHMLVDSFLMGVWLAALHFPLWPSFSLCIAATLNITMTSGWRGALRSFLAFMFGVLLAVTLFGFDFIPDTGWPTTIIALIGTSIYLIAVGNTSHNRNDQLRGIREKLKRSEQALHAGNEKLHQQLAEIQLLQDRLKEQALRDPMTGLFNRRYLDKIVPHELARCARDQMPLCLMMMDIDHFKHVNDTYGHQGGDEVIKGLAALLLASVRTSDVACRYGGEEFLLLLPNMPADTAMLRAEQWRAAFAEKIVTIGGRDISVTVSIGIACAAAEGSSAETLTRCADLALYRTKAEGRNRVVLYDAEMAPAV